MGVASNFGSWIARQIGQSLWQKVATEAVSPTAADAETLTRKAIAKAPVLWLLGKTGAGKTSIVHTLTGATDAEIGNGWQPCTPTARLYDWPAGAPSIRFLDTRGLGEDGYDPAEDIRAAEAQATAMMVVVKSNDMTLAQVAHVVAEARRRHRDWPVIVAQTTLHAHYPPGRREHPMPYPFTGGPGDDAKAGIPDDLRRALAEQRQKFSGLPGDAPRFVPVDLTRPEDGILPRDYGSEALLNAITGAGIRHIERLHLLQVEAENDAIARQARALVLGYASAAAGGGAVPVPIVGAAGLISTAALMLRALARRYGVPPSASHFAALGSAIGAGALAPWAARYGVRELLKLVPGVGTALAGAMNATAAFALIYALGQAAHVYFGRVRIGQTPSPGEVKQALQRALAEAYRLRKAAEP
ncbi:GTPase [Elioraea tepidiphila]|jgi:uncharacterized protein (DUF697 family)|uniref:YcjF family protein n=1 Tax=Elioraea tepidiphila TaxID=457934 RepID=UPI002FD97A2B